MNTSLTFRTRKAKRKSKVDGEKAENNARKASDRRSYDFGSDDATRKGQSNKSDTPRFWRVIFIYKFLFTSSFYDLWCLKNLNNCLGIRSKTRRTCRTKAERAWNPAKAWRSGGERRRRAGKFQYSSTRSWHQNKKIKENLQQITEHEGNFLDIKTNNLKFG